jgi:hypothetical protein
MVKHISCTEKANKRHNKKYSKHVVIGTVSGLLWIGENEQETAYGHIL